MAGMKTSPTLDILETFVHERFRDCDCLKEDIANYERFASVHEDKSYKFLFESVHRLILRKRLIDNRKAHEVALAGGGGGHDAAPAGDAAAANAKTKSKPKTKTKDGQEPKGPCYAWANTGQCGKTGCPYTHKARDKGSKSGASTPRKRANQDQAAPTVPPRRRLYAASTSKGRALKALTVNLATP